MADSTFLKNLMSTLSRAWVMGFPSALQSRQAAQALDSAISSTYVPLTTLSTGLTVFRASKVAANQTIAASTTSTAVLDSADIDTAGLYSGANNGMLMTSASAGYWLLIAFAYYNHATATTAQGIHIRVGGASKGQAWQNFAFATANSICAAAVVNVTAGNAVNFDFQNTDAVNSTTLFAGTDLTFLIAIRIPQ